MSNEGGYPRQRTKNGCPLPLLAHGGIRYAERESVSHSKSPTASVVVAVKLGTIQLSDLQGKIDRYKRVFRELRKNVYHESKRRHEFAATVQRYRTNRANDRSKFAFGQLKIDRERHLLLEELEAVHREFIMMKD